jgi:hypothetical protein
MNPAEIIEQIMGLLEQLKATVGGAAPAEAPVATEEPALPPATDEEVVAGIR